MPRVSTPARLFEAHEIPRGWSADRIPDLTGRLAVVTGASSGLGLATVRALAKAGARVILAVRSTSKGRAAAVNICSDNPEAQLDVCRLDLADGESVRDFAKRFADTHHGLDLLVNNAGVMAPPRRGSTADGFELQIGTNHLGHFALTGLLLPALAAAPAARVVTVTSTFHAFGRIDFDDLHSERRYRPIGAYAQSKLANLLFTGELNRRLTAVGSRVRAYAAHPGYASTNLQLTGRSPLMRAAMTVSNALFATSASTGALPTLCAATLPALPGGVLVGPRGLGGYRGSPAVVEPHPRTQDPDTAARLWEVSASATGVHYDFAADARQAA